MARDLFAELDSAPRPGPRDLFAEIDTPKPPKDERSAFDRGAETVARGALDLFSRINPIAGIAREAVVTSDQAKSGEFARDAAKDEGFLDRAESLGRRGIANTFGGLATAGAAITGSDTLRQQARVLREGITSQEVAGQTTWEDVKANPGIGSVGGYVVDAGIESLPGMAVAAIPGAGIPTLGLSQSGQIAQQRAENNGRDEATLGDLAKAAPAGFGSALLERAGIDSIFGAAGKNVVSRIGQAAAGEALTEGIQSPLEYAGGSLGTDVGFDPMQAAEQSLAGAVAGAGMGGAIRGGVETVDGTGRLINRRADDQRTGARGMREEAEDIAAASITPEDETSPLDTADIAAGRAELIKADAGRKVDQALDSLALPKVGRRVEIDHGNGQVDTGTMEDVFTADDGDGVVIKLDNGRTLREYRDTLADAGVTVREATMPADADTIDGQLAERAAAARNVAREDAALIPAVQSSAPRAQASGPVPAIEGDAAIADFMARTRSAESSGDDKAKNPRSSATGRYQFTNGTWLATYRAEFGNTGESDAQILAKRGDGATQDRLMQRLTRDNAAGLRAAGQQVTAGNLYLAHFAGIGGARSILQADPNASAEAVLGSAVINANPFLRGKSAAQVIQWAHGKMGGSAPAFSPVIGDETTIAQAPDAPFRSERQKMPDAQATPIAAREDAPTADDIRGDPIDDEWSLFSDTSGSLNIPRDQMPQIKAEHRGAMVNFINARGVSHQEVEVPAASLKPSQAEFSSAKVAKAAEFTGGNRAILVSQDGHVVDGHHQWMAARDKGEPVRAIQLNAPIRDVLALAHEFPSSETAEGGVAGVGTAVDVPSEAPPTVRVEKTKSGSSVAVIGANPAQLADISKAVPEAKGIKRADGAMVFSAKHAAAIRKAISGNAKPKGKPAGPLDMLKFIARNGGISMDGLAEASRKEGARGHDLRNTGALKRFIPGAGPLLRRNGMSLDQMGEALWEAGYFGPPETTPRPDENTVLAAIEQVTRTGERRFSLRDDAPVATIDNSLEEEANLAEQEAQQALDLRQAWDDAVARLGMDPLFASEIDDLRARGEAASVAPLDPKETDPDKIEAYLFEIINAELSDAHADAFYEVEDDYYADIEEQFARVAAQEGRGVAEGGNGPAPDAGDARAESERGEDGRTASKEDGSPLDRGEAIDPDIAERQRREARLRADAPLRGSNRTGQEQDGTMGLGLFDTADQPEMAFGGDAQPAETTPGSRRNQAKKGDAQAAPIKDFGETLEGARKHVWESTKDRLTDAQQLDAQVEPLSKSWPEPDYQKLIDGGADEYVVAAMRAMRDAIPNKPRSYGVVGWAKQVEALRDTAIRMLEDGGVADNFMQKLQGEFSRSLRDLQGAIDLYREFGHARSFKGIGFAEHFYNLYRGEQNVRKWVIDQKQKATAFSNWPRELAVGDTREEALAKFAMLLSNGGLDKKRNDTVRFDIYSYRSQPGFWIGKKVGKSYVDLKRFDTSKEARTYKVEHYDELVAELAKRKEIPPERKEINSPRIGINHRNGADITPEAFSEAFGFRGVQFGNYVEGARRQEDLNEAYDALMDLAGVIGVPAKALSLNGALGLAFGARGKGGKRAAKAHFEVDTVVINLTKKDGAGSLAHEWWHSLDNYFARQRGNGAFVTDTTGRPAGAMRPEMAEAFKNVMAAIRQTALKERSKNLDKTRTKDYWSTDIEMSARAFESYVIAKLSDEQFSNDYLANIVPEAMFALENGYPYLTAAEIPAVRAGFDAFFQAVETEQTDSGVRLFSIPEDGAIVPSAEIKGKTLPERRLNATQWYYRNLVGTTATTRDGIEVQFTKRGGDKTTNSKGDRLLSAVPAIREIIEQGDVVRRLPGDRKGVREILWIAAPVQIGDDTRTMAVMIRRMDNGDYHYTITDRELAPARPETDGANGANVKSIPASDGSGAVLNLFFLDEESNNGLGLEIGENPEAVAQRAEALEVDLRKRLDAMGLKQVKLRIRENMLRQSGAQGRYWPGLHAIEVALDAKDDTSFVLHHEAVHALRDLGVFSKSDWQLLAAAARRDADIWPSINRRYRDLTLAQREEEAVADMFGRYQAGHYSPKGAIERLLMRVVRFLSAVRNGLRGQGFDNTRTFREVFAEVADGRAATRGEQPDAERPFRAIPESRPREELSDLTSMAGDGSTWKGKAAEAFDKWRTGIQDRYLPLLRVQQQIERDTGKTLPESLNPYLGEELLSGRMGARLETLTDGHVGPLFDAMNDAGIGIDELESYLYARHAPERNARIAEINPEIPEGGSGMTDLEARAIMNRIAKAGQMDVMEALAARIDTIRDLAIATRVETGLMSQEQADEWRKTYQHYVPLRGFKEVQADPAAADRINRSGGGINVRGKESKSAFGRRSKADSPLAYTILQAEEAIVRGETNRVAQRFINLAQANPDPDFWNVNKVTERRRINEESGLVEDYTTNQLLAEDKDWTVSAKFNGVERRVTMNRQNPAARRLADSMKNLTQHKLDFVTKYLGAFNRFMSSVNTSWNPEFVIVNAFRDMQAAAVNLSGVDVDKIVSKVVKSYPGALKGSMKGAFGRESGEWGTWYREFLDAGGRVYFNHTEDVGLLKKRIEKTLAMKAAKPGDVRLQAKRTLIAVRDTVESLNMGVENAVRLATYRAARESGLTKDRAASVAKNVTVNFNRRGTFGPIVNSAYLFFNAGVQGTTRIFQAMRSKRVRKIMAGTMVAGFMIEMLNAMVAGIDDDDESFYDKVSDFDKSRNLVISLGGSQFLKIPLPYGYNVIFNAGRSLAEAARRGGDRWQETAGNFVTSVLDAFNPIGGSDSLLKIVSPTIVDPLVDLELNEDFTGRPILPKQDPYGPPVADHTRYWNSVGTHWKAITEFLNEATGGTSVEAGGIDVSPETLEYLAGTLLGAAGSFIDRVASIPGKALSDEGLTANDLPLARKVLGDKPGWYDKSAYYDRIGQVEKAVNETEQYLDLEQVDEAARYAEHHEKVLSLEGVAKAAKKDMKEIRKAKRANEHAWELGQIDEASYREEQNVVKRAEEDVITSFNSAWNRTMNGPEGDGSEE